MYKFDGRIGWVKALLPLAFAIITSRAAAQTEDSIPAYKQVQTPTSPALSILGKTSNDISHSDNPSSIALSLESLLQNGSSLPSNYSIEISPYWLIPHINDNCLKDTTRSLFESLLKTFTVSLGTAQVGDTTNPVTGASWGLRFSIASGVLSDSTIKKLKQDDSVRGFLSSHLDSLINADAQVKRAVAAAEDAGKKYRENNSPANKSAWKNATDALDVERRRVVKSIDSAKFYSANKASTLSLSRQGFVWDFATALAYHANKGAADSLKYNQFGAWTNIGYENSNFTILGMVRYLSNADTSKVGNYIDFGGKLLYDKDKYDLSIEWLCQVASGVHSTGLPWQHRSAFVAEYEFSDNNWLRLSFGKDFASGSANSLFANLGLSVNIFGQRYSAQ